MVKNIGGGNKAKKSARKSYSSNSNGQQGLQLSANANELYAIITKIYGGGMCQAQCIDGVSRLCVIRKKFKGRRKNDNEVKLESWVLVGLRDWEEKTDLLTVYSEHDKERLMSKTDANFTQLIKTCKELLGNNTSLSNIDSNIEFVNTQYDDLIENNNTIENVVLTEEDEINIDDI